MSRWKLGGTLEEEAFWETIDKIEDEELKKKLIEEQMIAKGKALAELEQMEKAGMIRRNKE